MPKSYEIYNDGIFGGVRFTDQEPDDSYVFRTFTQAKRALVARMQTKADQYRDAAAEFRQYKLGDVEAGIDVDMRGLEL